MKLFIITFNALLILSSFISFVSHADEVTVVIEDYDYPPRYFSLPDKSLAGIEIELVKEFFKRTGDKYNITLCPWKRCLKLMEVGQADVMPYLLKRPDREEYMHYIEPPYQKEANKCFYIKKGSSVKIDAYEDLYQYSIGVADSAKYFDPFDTDLKIKKEIVIKEKLLPEMLIAERMEAFIGACIPTDFNNIKNGHDNQLSKSTYQFSSHNPAYVAMSKKSKFIAKFSDYEKVMQQLVDEGVVNEIIARFLEN